MSMLSDFIHRRWKAREAAASSEMAPGKRPPVRDNVRPLVQPAELTADAMQTVRDSVARSVCMACGGRGKVACVICVLYTRKECEACERCHGSRFVRCPRCLTRFKTRAGRSVEIVDTGPEAA